MLYISEIIQKKPVFYVTRDIERALGLHPTEGYFIISNFTPFSKQIAHGWPNVFLIDEDRLLDTHELLAHPAAQKFITEKAHGQTPHILVFKNTSVIEKVCSENTWILLNPSAALAQKVEEKISQVEWLGDLEKYLPPHQIVTAKEVVFDGAPFILQFNRAHTGLGTMLISSESDLANIQSKFPERPVRITKFIDGPMFTSNNIVFPETILIGNMSLQITGLAPFTPNPFATIGNDWYFPHTYLKPKHFEKYNEMAVALGEKLRASGWKGLFGIDVIFDPEQDDLFLIEINARQPASTTYESILEYLQEAKGVTTFEAHLASLFGIEIANTKLIEIQNGAQIIQRVLDKPIDQEKIIQKLYDLDIGLSIIPYFNTDMGSDCIRIQTKQSLMQTATQFNELGEKIKKTLEELLKNEGEWTGCGK